MMNRVAQAATLVVVPVLIVFVEPRVAFVVLAGYWMLAAAWFWQASRP